MRICVLGAGAIGCFAGGVLASAGEEVQLIGRPWLVTMLRGSGLHLTDLEGRDTLIAKPAATSDPAMLRDAKIVIVAVKSGDTPRAAADIAAFATADALIVSFQNGVANADQLRALLPGHLVLAAMVPWNVAALGEGHFHRGTQGMLMIEAHERSQPLADAFNRARLACTLREDMTAVLWSKVLHNLNNAVNAMSGLPLLEQLGRRDYRLCLAACIDEALALLKHAQIRPAKIANVNPDKLPPLLRLPDFLYRPIMRRTLKIDALARSSMQDDLRAGKTTEVEVLNGAVVALARALGKDAPINSRMVALIEAAHGRPFTPITGKQLRTMLAV
jgi:2-dehydropantoate 2-reductase